MNLMLKVFPSARCELPLKGAKPTLLDNFVYTVAFLASYRFSGAKKLLEEAFRFRN